MLVGPGYIVPKILAIRTRKDYIAPIASTFDALRSPALPGGEITMENIVTIPEAVTASQVAEARSAFVGSLSASYGAGRVYAASLVALLGTAWITLAHDAKGAEGDAMRAERDALYADLRKAGHSNPSVKWKQIKGYAADLVKAEEGADAEEGEGEGEGESTGGAKHTRSIQLRLIEELSTLYKACKREKGTLTQAQNDAFTHVSAALAALGVDISQL